MIVRTQAYARAALVGNPSDGYYGKTISIILRNYLAEVTLYESPELVIEPAGHDISRFSSIGELIEDVKRHGYYGGVRLIKAATRRFGDYCHAHHIALEHKNFTIRYASNIPRLVGMAGSSAIITATLRALMAYYGVQIPLPVLPGLILSVEREELGIEAGLQDRVIQAYEGVVYMDFNRDLMRQQGHGRYESIDPALLPPLYVAFDANRAEGSERVHNRLRALFDEGEPKVVGAMQEFASLAEQTRAMLLAGRGREIGPLLNRNFDLRKEIMHIAAENLRMIDTARSTGASAQFTGSGGAIIGTYEGEKMYRALESKLTGIGCTVFKPKII